MRISPEQIEQIRELVKTKSYREIAKELGISVYSVSYYSSEENRKKRIKMSVNYFKNLSRDRKKKIYNSRKELIRNFLNEKYKNDPNYREKRRLYSKEYYHKKKKEDVKSNKDSL